MCRMPTRCYRLVRLSRFVGTSNSASSKIRSSLECQRIFCGEHSIAHGHPSKQEAAPVERYNRHVHLDQIAEWERRAIEKIRRQANEARRPLIAPPTPIEPPSTVTNPLQSTTLTRLLTVSSTIRKQVSRSRRRSASNSDNHHSLVTSHRSIRIAVRRNVGRNDQ